MHLSKINRAYGDLESQSNGAKMLKNKHELECNRIYDEQNV